MPAVKGKRASQAVMTKTEGRKDSQLFLVSSVGVCQCSDGSESRGGLLRAVPHSWNFPASLVLVGWLVGWSVFLETDAVSVCSQAGPELTALCTVSVL